jgi:prepilin-type N-terminal cleavage/methylation domain-containing protein
MDCRARSTLSEGFTLIEVVVAIGIIVLVMGFSAPSFAKMFKNKNLENAGTLIASAVNEVRNDAVTTKQAHRIVFLRDGLRIYREPKGIDKGGFVESLRPYDPQRNGITYDLGFAGKPAAEIPTDLAMILDDPENPPPSDTWQVTDRDISIRFLPDGTVDFGEYEDIPSFQFNAVPAEAADITFFRVSDQKQRGYLDIRPTGRTAFKIEEVE